MLVCGWNFGSLSCECRRPEKYRISIIFVWQVNGWVIKKAPWHGFKGYRIGGGYGGACTHICIKRRVLKICIYTYIQCSTLGHEPDDLHSYIPWSHCRTSIVLVADDLVFLSRPKPFNCHVYLKTPFFLVIVLLYKGRKHLHTLNSLLS